MNDSVLQGETVVDNIFGRDMLLTTLIQQGTWPFEWYIPQLGEMTQYSKTGLFCKIFIPCKETTDFWLTDTIYLWYKPRLLTYACSHHSKC